LWRKVKLRKTILKLSKTKIKGKSFHLVVYPGLDGERTRKHFKSLSEAKEFLDRKRVELTNFGTAAATLNERDRAEYIECRDILKTYGISLREAVNKLIPQLKAEQVTSLVSITMEEFLKAKKSDGLSVRYRKDLKSRIKLFSKNFGARTMASITTAEIDDWLRSLPGGAVNRNNYKRNIGVFFSYAEKRGLILQNPVILTSKAKEIAKNVGVFTPDQASKLLASACKEILPAIALGLFAGMRPESEVMRLDWGKIDLDRKLISVDPINTKLAAKRFITIPENLEAWLLPYKGKTGPVSPTGDKYYSLLEKAKKAAKITVWPADVLRHSYGSYHYAKFQDMGKAMAEMGHSNSRTFLQHYRERVDPDDAEVYWKIRPPSKPDKGLPQKSAKKCSLPPPPKKRSKRV
jgi:integrase